MTPKQKAEELYNKMENSIFIEPDPTWEGQCKQCALLAVEFARQEFKDHCAAEYGTDGSPDDHFDAIKQEINNL